MTKEQALSLLPVVAVTPENAALLNEMAEAIYEGSGVMVPPECPACGGPGGYLGRLGSLEWVRCQDCGLEYNWQAW